MSVADDMYWVSVLDRILAPKASELSKLSALTSWLGGDFAKLWDVTVGSEWVLRGHGWRGEEGLVATVLGINLPIVSLGIAGECDTHRWRLREWQEGDARMWPLSLGSYDEAMARAVTKNVESIDEPIPYTIGTPPGDRKVFKARQPIRAGEMVTFDLPPRKTRDEQLAEYMALMPEGFSRSGWRRAGVAIMSGEVEGLRFPISAENVAVYAMKAIDEASPDTWHEVVARLYRTAPPDPSEPDATPWDAYDV